MDQHVTLPKPGSSVGPRERIAPYLFLAMEAGRAIAGSARFILDDVDVVVIGRGSERRARRSIDDGVRRLVLQVPDPWMSQTHVRLQRQGGECVLVDAGSRNGSLVNASPATTATLHDGDVIELGQTLFVYRAALPGPAGAADILDAGERPLGTSTVLPWLEQRLGELAQVAPTSVTIALHGPSGTGKEVLARAVHELSRRAGPFIAVNCGAIPDNLVESELFGHRRGAFSGAAADRTGLIAAAAGGTLFLDEIGDLPLGVQPALLRVLQERAVTPVGAVAPIRVDFRLISATHRDLGAMVAAGDFREDLWARLAGYTLTLPPLAERREDLATITADVLERLAPERDVTLTADAARALLRYHWPRNVRELERALETALALASGGEIDLRHLPASVAGDAPRAARSELEMSMGPGGDALPRPSPGGDDPRRAVLIAALRQHGGNVSAVARALGKPRSQIQRWMRRWNLRTEDFALP